MNLDLTSSSSRTHEHEPKAHKHKPKKSNTKTQDHQKIKPRKIINEYHTKQNQSTYIHKRNY